MFGHLLDGDLASNHLSWQWVAGTGSHKPYLFNADNVARCAPAAWHSPGTVVDDSYEALDCVARRLDGAEGDEAGAAGEGVAEPPVSASVPAGFVVADAGSVAGRPVWLVHPWSLADPPAGLPDGCLKVGVTLAEWHAAWPWSEARWRFVAGRMQALCDRLWHADGATLYGALSATHSVQGVDNPHLGAWPGRRWLAPVPRLFDDPGRRCNSFSQFWTGVTKRLVGAGDALKR
jgi:deoxyribodipyrimidine photo-lyase